MGEATTLFTVGWDSALDGEAALDSPTPSPTPNTSLMATDTGAMATRCSFLAVFLVAGFVANCVLISIIAQSKRLRGVHLNLMVISLAVVNIVDCLANMPLILGASIAEQWDYGMAVCRLNAFTLQLVSVNLVLIVVFMCLERMLALRGLRRESSGGGERRRRLGIQATSALVVYAWVQAAAFSIPLAIEGATPVRPYPARYLCTIGDGASVVYLGLMSALCYLLPALLSIACLIYIIRRGVLEKLAERRRSAQNNYAPSESAGPERKVWAEVNASKYVGVVFLLWAVLHGPYLILSTITWYRTSRELSDVSEVSEALSVHYPWQLELAFTWMRLSFPTVVPMVTFCWKKEVWQRFKNWILCGKANHVLDASPQVSPQHRGRGATAAPPGGASPHKDAVPVLFATDNGIHFQTYTNATAERDDVTGAVAIAGDAITQYGNSQMLTAHKCDVMGSQDFLQLEDTSDYDSDEGELDPFSASNPVSVRTEGGDSRQSGSTDSRHDSAKSSTSLSSSVSLHHPNHHHHLPHHQKAQERKASHDFSSQVSQLSSGRDGSNRLSAEGTHIANLYIVSEKQQQPKKKPTKKISRQASREPSPRGAELPEGVGVDSPRGRDNDAFEGDVEEAVGGAEGVDGVDSAAAVERTSNDSGMGSLEGHKRKAHPTVRARKASDDDSPMVTKETASGAVSRDPDSEVVTTPTGSNNEDIRNGQKKKKKPKKFVPQEEPASEDIRQSPVVRRKKPPSSLEPIGATYNNQSQSNLTADQTQEPQPIGSSPLELSDRPNSAGQKKRKPKVNKPRDEVMSPDESILQVGSYSQPSPSQQRQHNGHSRAKKPQQKQTEIDRSDVIDVEKRDYARSLSAPAHVEGNHGNKTKKAKRRKIKVGLDAAQTEADDIPVIW